MLLKRTITGICILIAISGFIALRLVSPLFFDAFALIIIYACLIEMFLAYKVSNKKFFKIPLFLLPVAIWAIFKFSNNPLIWLVIAYILLFTISMFSELIINANERKNGNNEVNTNQDIKQNSLLSLTKTTMHVAVFPTLLLGFLFGINNLGFEIGFVGIIMVFAISIFTDVFAYCFGMMFGRNSKHKLAPEISPKKSVVGSVFGAIGGLIAGGLGWLFFYYLGWFNVLHEITLANSIILFSLVGLFGSLLTQFGDLVASAFKREVGLKDFGNIFPGHGGFMDRVDGQMFCATLVYALLIVFI